MAADSSQTPANEAAHGVYRPSLYAADLSQAIELEEASPRYLATVTSFVCLLFIAGTLVWSAFTYVNEVAVAAGAVVPQGKVNQVQHLDGGIVVQLHVNNGDAVQKGDLLVSLDPATAESELKQMLNRQLSLQLQDTRLSALRARKTPDFSAYPDAYSHLVAEQAAIYEAQLNSFNAEQLLLRSQIQQRKDEITGLTNQIASLKKELAIYQEQARMRQEALSRGIVSRAEYLSAKARVAEYENQMRQTIDALAVARSSLAESQQRGRDSVARFNRDLALEAEQIRNELAEVDSTLIRLEARGERQEVRAQVTGIVQALEISGAGAVISPSQVIMELVPTQEEFIVEARVQPMDIGYVSPGQTAKIKFESYDFARFGTLEGKVKQLSASTYLDAENMPYYRAEITLPRRYLGANEGELTVIPGMTVTADIQTGQKTLLEYMLRPVTRGLDQAFHER